MRKGHVFIFAILVAAADSISVKASLDSIGPNGINSAGLLGLNGMPLTGSGIGIGQVEVDRPGRRVADGGPDDAAHSDVSIVPAGVFLGNAADTTPNTHTDAHAQWVAGVMISIDATRRGVATEAELYSAARNPSTNIDEGHSQSAQHIATRNGGDVRAINMSFGITQSGSELDGNDLLTQLIDWSAAHHDVLYVVAGNESGGGTPVPSENYNGITIGASSKVGSVFAQVAGFNDFSELPPGDRKIVSILAPGENIDMVGFAGVSAPSTLDSGTSYAAPHVTGTVALLQQFAEQKIAAPTTGWDADARRHEVMKAVLLNSADKIIDNGTFMLPGEPDPVPNGYLLGMDRTVLDQNCTPPGSTSCQTWIESEAYGDNAFEPGSFIPLDDQMGAGHLNAARALEQFNPGEFDSDGTATVPVRGWDYGLTDGADDINKYVFADTLQGGSFISISLAWDRVVIFNDENATPGEYDIGDTFEPWTDPIPPADDVIQDLDLYLLPAGATDTSEAIATSLSNDSTIEHLFFQIPSTGNYEFWVQQFDSEFGEQPYAAAWWALSADVVLPPGDYNGDQIVDSQDYNVWRGDFGESITAGTGADGNGDGTIDAADYVVWRKILDAVGSGSGLASVPEPKTIVCALSLLLINSRVKRRVVPFRASFQSENDCASRAAK
jgi:hypothetical protein